MSENVGDKAREYQRRYYLKNRDEINARKRERYGSDPKVREAARKRAMARYLTNKPEGEGRKVRRYNHPRVVEIGGETVLVHCVREYADGAGRNVQTITKWEEREIVPAPTMVDRAGRRWYSKEHMEAVSKAVEKYDKAGRRDLSLLADMVKAEFERRERKKRKKK
jgi:hypothetical protein